MCLTDCEEVREIHKNVNYLTSKYQNEIIIKAGIEGLFVAQDIKTGEYS